MKRIMILFAAVFSLIWGGCSDPFENQAFRETDKMPAASYLFFVGRSIELYRTV